MKHLRILLFPFVIILAIANMAYPQTISEVQPALQNLSNFMNVRDFTMNAGGDEAYFSVQSPLGEISAIAMIQKKNGKWNEPLMVKFSGTYKDLEPFLSPDGLKLYFVSDRPIDNNSKDKKDMDIWYVKRKNKDGKWSQPKNIGSPINTKGNEFYPSVAANGNLYFTLISDKSKGEDDIFFSEWKDNEYSEPVSLSESINTKGAEYNAYIAPDESFILFGGWRRKGGIGSGDIYISFRNSDGTWKPAENLGEEINSKYMDFCPFVDWKTKTLYFTSRRSAIEPKSIDSLKDFETETGRYSNGLSRIYKISIADKLIPIK